MIKDDIIDLFRAFQDSGSSIKSLNYAFLFIPKIERTIKIKDLMLVSQGSGRVVSECQHAFVGGRGTNYCMRF